MFPYYGKNAVLTKINANQVRKTYLEAADAHYRETEAKCLVAVQKYENVSVPFLYQIEEEGLILRMVEGESLQAIFQKMPLEDYKLSAIFQMTQEAIHTKRVAGLRRQNESLGSEILKNHYLTKEEKRFLCYGLSTLWEGYSLCHGMLNLHHILYENGHTPVVVDWGYAFQGDPSVDAALTFCLLQTMPFLTKAPKLHIAQQVYAHPEFAKKYVTLCGWESGLSLPRMMKALPFAAASLMHRIDTIGAALLSDYVKTYLKTSSVSAT